MRDTILIWQVAILLNSNAPPMLINKASQRILTSPLWRGVDYGAILNPDMGMEKSNSVGGRWGRSPVAASSIPNLNDSQPDSTRWVGDEAVLQRSRRWVSRILTDESIDSRRAPGCWLALMIQKSRLLIFRNDLPIRKSNWTQWVKRPVKYARRTTEINKKKF